MALPGHLTVREVILERLEQWLKTMQEGVDNAGVAGNDNAYDFDVTEVFRTPLENREQGTTMKLALGLIEGPETTLQGVGIGNHTKLLTVNLEWRSMGLVDPDRDMREHQRVNNQILGNLQRRVKSNINLPTVFGGTDGVCTNILEIGNLVDTLEADNLDRQLEGSIQFQIIYKTEIEDPRKRPGGSFLPDPSC